MAGNYSELKASINEIVKENGIGAITGTNLQLVLNNIVSVVGANATFAGIATPDTNPGTPDQNVFYIATVPGTYANFGGLSFSDSHLYILYNKDGSWALSLLADTATSKDVLSEIQSLASEFNVFDLSTTEIEESDTSEGALLNEATGEIKSYSDTDYVVKRYNVEGAHAYYIISSTQFKNALFSVFNADGVLLDKKVIDTQATVSDETIYVSPANTSYILVAYRKNIKEGGLFNFKFAPRSLSELQALASKLNVFDLDIIEKEANEVNEGALLIDTTGEIKEYGDNNYVVKKYNVEGAHAYNIVTSTQYKNALFSVFDAGGRLLDIKVPDTQSAISDSTIYVTGVNASYILVAYNKNIRVGGLFDFDIIPYKVLKKWEGLKWIVVGDSLTEENSRTSKHYFDYIAEETGIQVENMGVGGTGYKKRDDTDEAFYQRVASIATDADAITIFGSFNDLGAAPIGEPTDAGTETICGCINTTLDTILNAYIAAGKIPHIGVVTPTPWITTMPIEENAAGALYCDAIINCCRRKSIPVLDLYRCSNLHPDNEAFRALA